MKYSLPILFSWMIFILPIASQALYTEVGFTYGRKKTTFDANNNFDSEYMTGSVSLYFAERVALELSYTDAVSLQNQRASSADVPRTVYQKTQIIGGDLIYVFADRKA
ncbi:MAG: porin family protein, partial [Bdellovibrionaceae bacterium]|nr:porin family protein [Pseudobdellovibrionaceae bacterium]